MPICIECRYPVSQLYHVLQSKPKKAATPEPSLKPALHTSTPSLSLSSPVSPNTPSTENALPVKTTPTALTDTSLSSGTRGGGESSSRPQGATDVRLTQCPRCRRFADKYVEHDFVVLFIDLVLVKPQVYRHLLFNRLGRDADAFDPSIKRLGTLILLFEVYLTWSFIEVLPTSMTASSPIPQLPIFAQYAFYLVLCTLTTAAQHLTIRTLASVLHYWFIKHDKSKSKAAESTTSSTSRPQTPGPQSPSMAPATVDHDEKLNLPPTSTRISTAIFVSSCMKLFPILMVVWKYDDGGAQLAKGVDYAVALQNVEALRILLGSGYIEAFVLVGAGLLASRLVRALVLNMVDLGSAV